MIDEDFFRDEFEVWYIQHVENLHEDNYLSTERMKNKRRGNMYQAHAEYMNSCWVDWLCLCAITKQCEAYESGWICCSHWANRDDLISDVDSQAYLEDMVRRLT